MNCGKRCRQMLDGSAERERRKVFTLCAHVLLAGLVLIVVTGCGRYKQDLEEAKQRIDKLTADSKRCAEISAGLEKDKQRLSEERQAVDTRIETMLKELGDLKKTNSSLSQQMSKLKKENRLFSAHVNALRHDKSELSKQLQALRDRAVRPVSPVQPQAAGERQPAPVTGAPPKLPETPEAKSPCDAVIAFMKASQQVVRMHKGAQRSEMLEKVKQKYAPTMKGAPEKAVTIAEAWVAELSSSWDKPGDNTVFSLISKRNAVLKACGKKPGDAGF